jgi:hypothetical protein
LKVEIEIDDGLLKKIKALSILKPVEGGVETMVAVGLENWVDAQIVEHITGKPSPLVAQLRTAAPPGDRQARRRLAAQEQLPNEHDAFDASGISSGLSDDEDEYEDEARTRDPEAFIRPEGGLTEEAMDRDMRVSDPEHEAKVDASVIREKKYDGSDSYRTPEEMFAEHSGLPTPPAVSEDSRAQRRRKKQSGKGRASSFTGFEENTI